MSIFGIANRAYHNNKQSIQYDQGWGLDHIGKLVPTTYQVSHLVSALYKFNSSTFGGAYNRLDIDEWPRDQTPRVGDTFFISGTENFDGEHEIESFGDDDKLQWFFYDYDNLNDGAVTIAETTGWFYYAPTALGEILVADARVMTHPSFSQIEGQGIYTYPFPPDITRNFIYQPAGRVDGVVQRTLSSNIFIQQDQLDEDIIITEIWQGGTRQLSTLAEMFRTFYAYYKTIPAIGESIGWEPRDFTTDRFLIQIVNVQLGGPDMEYKEIRTNTGQNAGAYIDRQLSVQFKLVKRTKPPIPRITLVGV